MDHLLKNDPLQAGADANQALWRHNASHRRLSRQAEGRVLKFAGTSWKGTVDAAVVGSLQEGVFFSSDFWRANVESSGPQVGKQLRSRSSWQLRIPGRNADLPGASGSSGFTVWAAVLTVFFNDTLITVGAFSLLNWENSLTVIAAILTLIGYCEYDTIVVFRSDPRKTSSCAAGSRGGHRQQEH